METWSDKMLHYIKHLLADPEKEPSGHPRSTEWPKVREEHLKKFPVCAACGSKEKLQVHHCMPFHLQPELELDPNNLITLCESSGSSCHLKWGHLGSFKLYNPKVRETAEYIYDLLVVKRETMSEHIKEGKDETEGAES